MESLGHAGAWIDATIDRLLHAGQRLGRVNAVWLSFCVVGAITAADYALGPAVQLSTMYSLAPIVNAWCGTRRDGMQMAVLTAAVSTTVHAATGSVTWQPVPLVATLLARAVGFGLIALLVAQVRVTTERYEHLSTRDPLTGLLNHSALRERLTTEIARATRYAFPITLLFADVDEFKEVNDRLGHAVGDRFLVEVARALTTSLRPVDVIGRVGGDEFVVVLPETDESGARALCERLHVRLAELEAQYGTGLSIGLAAFPEAPASAEIALDAADRAMYAAKREAKSLPVLDPEPAL